MVDHITLFDYNTQGIQNDADIYIWKTAQTLLYILFCLGKFLFLRYASVGLWSDFALNWSHISY